MHHPTPAFLRLAAVGLCAVPLVVVLSPDAARVAVVAPESPTAP